MTGLAGFEDGEDLVSLGDDDDDEAAAAMIPDLHLDASVKTTANSSLIKWAAILVFRHYSKVS